MNRQPEQREPAEIRAEGEARVHTLSRPTRAAPVPGTETYRRHYKVNRLPVRVQRVIFSGYACGRSYRQIRAAVRALGHDIGESSLGRYWRDCWQREQTRLRRAWLMKETLKDDLLLDPESANARLAEELLYTTVVSKLEEVEQEAPLPLLREAREQSKAAEKKGSGDTRPPGASNPIEQAREIRRRWRKLYGLEEADEAEESPE